MIVLKKGVSVETVCAEAETPNYGRFSGLCRHRYSRLLNGFAGAQLGGGGGGAGNGTVCVITAACARPPTEASSRCCMCLCRPRVDLRLNSFAQNAHAGPFSRSDLAALRRALGSWIAYVERDHHFRITGEAQPEWIESDALPPAAAAARDVMAAWHTGRRAEAAARRRALPEELGADWNLDRIDQARAVVASGGPGGRSWSRSCMRTGSPGVPSSSRHQSGPPLAHTHTCTPRVRSASPQVSDHLDGIYHYNYTGLGVNVYMVDTGIRATHEVRRAGGQAGG